MQGYFTMAFFFFQASCEPDDYSCPTSNGQVCLDGDAECDGIELCPGLEDERDCGEFFNFLKDATISLFQKVQL